MIVPGDGELEDVDDPSEKDSSREGDVNFLKVPCGCKVAGCEKYLAIAPGVVEHTLTLGIREHDRTIAQTYLTVDWAHVLIGLLTEWAAIETTEAENR